MNDSTLDWILGGLIVLLVTIVALVVLKALLKKGPTAKQSETKTRRADLVAVTSQLEAMGVPRAAIELDLAKSECVVFFQEGADYGCFVLRKLSVNKGDVYAPIWKQGDRWGVFKHTLGGNQRLPVAFRPTFEEAAEVLLLDVTASLGSVSFERPPTLVDDEDGVVRESSQPLSHVGA